MSTQFGDITFYSNSPNRGGTPEYNEETALQNYISELYIKCMHGYKPPNTTRVCIQPAYYNIWERTWKMGSIISIAAYFDYSKYSRLKLKEKYKCILDIIHEAMLKLSEEYGWQKIIFKTAYEEVIASDFTFRQDYPIKTSKDKQKNANIVLTKTETITIVNISLVVNGQNTMIKLFDKKNWWWYDSTYRLAKKSKWFDNDRFGLFYKPCNWGVWYSIKNQNVTFEKDGISSTEANVTDVFTF